MCGSATPDRYCHLRRAGRADDCNGLENRRGESLRGFESPALRHFLLTDLTPEFFYPVCGVEPVGVAVASDLVTVVSRSGI